MTYNFPVLFQGYIQKKSVCILPLCLRGIFLCRGDTSRRRRVRGSARADAAAAAVHTDSLLT